jgi:hypothetical protein
MASSNLLESWSFYPDADYNKVMRLIIELTLVLDLELLVMSLPALFLQYPKYWSNKPVRIALYFAGCIVFLITVLVIKIGPVNRVIYVITAVVFVLVHSISYFRLVKKTN